MKKLSITILFVLFAACAAQGDEPQQSTTGPVPPAAVIERDTQKALEEPVPVPVGVQHTIAGVPGYLWRHGCGPTAVGMVVGYYDTHGYDDLIPGDANTQTASVNQAIASSGAAPPYLHYEDYSLPIDSPPTLQPDAWIARGYSHTDDCIADYMDTSKSTRSNYYGWSWSSDVCPAFTGYVNQQNSSHSPACTEYQWSTGALTWAVLTNEIDNNRPMVFLVDSDGDGSTDHFVTVVGYDDSTPKKYGCLDTWAPAGTIRWEQFRGMSSSYSWGIWGGWSFSLAAPPSPQYVKWEQKPDLSTAGMDIRLDRNDGIPRIMADDFQCTTTGRITDVHFWGSWKYDAKETITRIHLSIHSDDPVGPGGTDPQNTYSKPDLLLWEMDFFDNDFNETLYYELPDPDHEWWWDIQNQIVFPTGDTQVWKYDIYIDPCEAFVQEGTEAEPIVYWLDIYVETTGGPQESDPGKFGWKTSEEHWNDDAVHASNFSPPYAWQELRYPVGVGHPYEGDSVDMAFVITTDTNQPDEPGPIIKWEQKPDLTETGIDVNATEPMLLADDFNCNTTGDITKIVVWGSWLNDELPEGDPNLVRFTLSIHNDMPVGDPCNPDQWSKPRDTLWYKVFDPGMFTAEIEREQIEEGWMDPPINYIFPADTVCWKYTFTIDRNETFEQLGTPNEPIIYWLDVQAKPFAPYAKFGWKTSINHWNDDAVWGMGIEPYPGPWMELRYPPTHQLYPDSIDLAFAIYTDTNEPNEPEDYSKPLMAHTKWSQPPIETDPDSEVPSYCGWDELSYKLDQQNWIMVADDFRCLGTMPVTSIHWWGSFLDWEGNEPPLPEPNAWQIGFWSNIPDPNPYNPDTFSRPDKLLWQIKVDTNQTAEPSLISYWKFNEGAGTIAGDSANGNNGAISGATWTTGKEGTALYFHGGGQWNSGGDAVVVPHSASLDITVPFTIEAWIKATGTDKYHAIVDKFDGSATLSYGYTLYLTDGNLRLSLYGGATGNKDCSVVSVDLRDNQWHHVASTWDGIDIKLYIDGTAKPTSCWGLGLGPASTTHNLGIGKRLYGWGGYLPFEGKIDQVAIFNTNLSGDTIKRHYQKGLSGFGYDIEKIGDIYQHNLYLEPNDYFWQDQYTEDTNDNVFWLSIAAVYPDNVTVGFPWGWHTRPWHWMDDAVRFPYNGTLVPGITLDPCSIEPIKDPLYEESYDLAFELNTDPNYIKWEQLYTGIRHWLHYEDVNSTFNMLDPVNEKLVADDWQCLKRTPITAIVWWGSYLGYNYQACGDTFMQLPVKPDRFKLTFWTDVPAGADPCYTYSHPGEEIWEYTTDDVDEVLVGFDKHPHPAHGGTSPYSTEPVFRYSVRLPEENWFKQPNYNEVFWLSVQAIYEAADPPYLWGWTNHDHVFNDDAVQGYRDMGELKWIELYDQTGKSEDMSFMLFTDSNECSDCANYNLDANVNFLDYAEFAINWFWSGSAGGYNNGDLDCDGDVDLADLDIFCQQWLTYCP
ncbi:MAG: hypothetical protein JW804_07895 [Sedimentisphaerales bacterium]|nr:hypothetical protein [Sedimentisphaerales bacterium]